MALAAMETSGGIVFLTSSGHTIMSPQRLSRPMQVHTKRPSCDILQILLPHHS